MRVIAGECRGKALISMPGEQTRPTLNRVKEGMFSAVQNLLCGAKVLDLYAGSGQLGIEALSRGAIFCHFVDSEHAAVQVVRRNLEALNLSGCYRVDCTDAKRFLSSCAERFDLVFLDPPFETVQWDTQLEQLLPICKEGAQVLCETGAKEKLPQAVGGLELQKQYRYGTVCVWRYAKI